MNQSIKTSPNLGTADINELCGIVGQHKNESEF